MSHKFLVIFITVLTVLVALSAIGSAGAAGGTPLPVTLVDGVWSNPTPAVVASHKCYKLDNTDSSTDENKISAGLVSGKEYCYIDSPPAPNFDEGSGFGFNGAIDVSTDVPPGAPFLLGVITHYNRHVRSIPNTWLDGAQLNVRTDIAGGADPASIIFSWDMTLDETSNDPSLNDNNVCPYPAGSFYSTKYLNHNGGFDTYPVTYGQLYTHPYVGGFPPAGERTVNQWLCGDGITAKLTSPVQQVFSFNGQELTLVLVGISYPPTSVANMSRQAVAALCGTGPTQESPALLLETKELNDTDACIWAAFSVPSAVTMAKPLHVAPAAPMPFGPLLTVGTMVGLMLVAFLLWKRQAAG